MKRVCYFIALMALSSSAHAGSYSFVVAGHRIHIEAPRHCRSASCLSVSIPVLARSNRRRDRDDDVAASAAPAPAPAPAPASSPANSPPRAVAPVAAVAPPASQPPAQPVASAPPAPAPAPELASTTAKIVLLPAPPPPAPVVAAPQPAVAPPPPKAESVKTIPVEAPPVVAPKPIPVPTPVPQKVSQETEEEPADTPLGDWQTEGNKGTVRVERCGQAMCGYLLHVTSDDNDETRRVTKGDTVLINMKSKTDTAKSDAVWSGNIYSRSSGSTYYAKMTMKGANTLRVEACALGRFFCSGNDWTRIEPPSKLMSSQQISRPPS
jgi:uncharacterized protein (DUF2147 family)